MAKKSKFDYFDAYESLAQLAVSESDLLVQTIENFDGPDKLADVLTRAHEIEHAGDEVNHDIFKFVATDFMPPIDREDLIELAHALDDVIDSIEEIIQRFYMYNVTEMHSEASEFARLIHKGCKALDKAMEDFRNFKRSKKFKSLIVDINTCEEEADQLLIEVIRKIHTSDEPVTKNTVVWTGLYERMEDCSDTCEHVADIMNTIVLKNV